MVLNLLLACLEAEICVGERNEHGSLCTGYIVPCYHVISRVDPLPPPMSCLRVEE